MKATIKIISNAPIFAGIKLPFANYYIKSFDPYYPDELGTGHLVTTPYISEAMIFEDGAAAIKYWQQQSPTVPLRPDGKPNRPLTAFTVCIEPYEEIDMAQTTLPDIETVSAKVHEAWMKSKRNQGVTTRKSETGEELMVPYSELSEEAKQLDRGTVIAVYEAIKSLETTDNTQSATA